MSDDLPVLPARPSDGHKGTFGRVVCAGGSRGMAGSVALSAMAALRSGAGLVTAAVPDRILETVAGFDPAVMTRPLPCDAAGRFTLTAVRDALSLFADADAGVVGPGLSRADQALSFAREVVREADCPLVVDADALFAVAADLDACRAGRPRVYTPHPGEMARLCGVSIDEVQANREEIAADLAGRTGAVVVLKGAGTVVTEGGRTAVNTTGNDGLATAGTGDVLAGMIAALLAAGMGAFEAARLAVHVHGAAADRLTRDTSRVGLTSTALVAELPAAWGGVA